MPSKFGWCGQGLLPSSWRAHSPVFRDLIMVRSFRTLLMANCLVSNESNLVNVLLLCDFSGDKLFNKASLEEQHNEEYEEGRYWCHGNYLLCLKISEHLILFLQLVHLYWVWSARQSFWLQIYWSHLLPEFWAIGPDRNCQLCDGCSLCFLVTCNHFFCFSSAKVSSPSDNPGILIFGRWVFSHLDCGPCTG